MSNLPNTSPCPAHPVQPQHAVHNPSEHASGNFPADYPKTPKQTKRAVGVDLFLAAATEGCYTADLQVTLPESVVPISPLSTPALVAFEQTQLCALALDSAAYGAALGAMLFADSALRTAFAQARAVAAQHATQLRLRLTIHSNAEELHALRWECLTDPDAPGQALVASDRMWLSRALPCHDWQPVLQCGSRSRVPLRAVALVSAPHDLPDYGLAVLDVAQESAWLRAQLGGHDLAVLGDNRRAALPQLLQRLHTGCDLLIILAHGRCDETGQTWLYLEDETGGTAPLAGQELAALIAALAEKPRWAILACCESGGDGSGATMAALGPQLVRAGVPAVLAMQGQISHETLARFLPACLQSLIQNGQIDRAVGQARSLVHDRPDWWVPALWVRPGAEAGRDEGGSIGMAEEQTSVAGIPNPYRGLRAFTAAEQDIFAGRDRITQALVRRLAAEDGDRLLFLVGASGSGKSSLARAGLFPALEAQLRKAERTVETLVLDHPGRAPAATLARLLNTASAPSATILVILLDQFEELWSQTEPAEAQRALDLLIKLATESARPLRLVATMRSDFLPQLVADVRYEPYERRKVVVRAMSAEELADAIQCPIQVRYPDKRLEPALIQRLAQDAAQDASYLPLLQVTLEDLWRGGHLRLAAYKGLADAIQRRAELVFNYRDHDTLRQEPRSNREQQILGDMLLDLVRVSPGDEQHETRWRRTRAELTQGDPQRERLLADLAAARLLRTDRESEADDAGERSIETVDVVHEALLQDWPRLREAIAGERERLRRRERFLLALHEWNANRHSDDYLLSGVRLAEAEALRQYGDSVFAKDDAQRFYRRSVERRDRERQRQIRRARITVAALSVLTALALLGAGAASWFGAVVRQREAEARNSASTAVAEQQRADRNAAEARQQQQIAENQLRVAEARRLATEAIILLSQDKSSERALLLAIEAIRLDANPTTRQALQKAVAGRRYATMLLGRYPEGMWKAVFSPDGQHILTPLWDSTTRLQLWSVAGRSLATFSGHTGTVRSIVFSPDGRYILTASNDKTARVWNMAGQSVITLSGHKKGVRSAVFSTDGRYILTASDDATAYLWDTKGQMLALFFGHTGAVHSAVFSPDGHSILTASDDGTARLWDTKGQTRATLSRDNSAIQSAVFRPDGRRILTTSDDGTAQLWDVTGQPLATLSDPAGDIESAVFSPDGSLVLTVSGNTAQLWGAAGQALSTRFSHTAGLKSPVFSPDGRRILTVSDEYTAQLWDAAGQLLATLSSPVSSISSAVFSPDGRHILTASPNSDAQVWDAEGQPCVTLSRHTSDITQAVFSPDGRRILTASLDGTARLWDATGKPMATFSGHRGSIWSAVFSPNGQYILTASDDGTARLWDAEGERLLTLTGHTGSVRSAVFSPDGRYILTAAWDGTARLWDMEAVPLATFSGHRGAVRSAVFSPDGRYILTASWDSTARLWDIAGKPLGTLSGHTSAVQSAVFSPDGQHILTVSNDDTARLWDTSGTGLATLSGHKDDVNNAVFSPDGRFILTTSNDNTVRLWDASGMPLKTFSGHTDNVWSVVFSPDGRHILTASLDATARLWDMEGKQVAMFSGHMADVRSAVFSPDGKRILTASADGTARLWPVEQADWVAAAKCQVSRTLTEEEIRDYQVPEPLHFDTAALAQRQCPPVYSWEQ
ncbi:MAG TPA: CHAT domain-containing protein [Roseiflexaceae bacterium]|nr:CHAT domain-containing protein [Roseiflexaceae bacterium]